MQFDNERWRQFEHDIAVLFQVAGYTTALNVQLSGQEFDIIATRRELGDLNSRIAVECKSYHKNVVGNADVQAFINAFNASSREHGLTHGILVTNRGFSRQAFETIRAHPQLRLITSSDLEHELLGARTYLESAKRNYRSDFSNYIALAAEQVGVTKGTPAKTSDIADLCRQRLSDKKRSLTVLLGDFGSGKTTIAEQVHSGLSDAFLRNESGVFPLILYLRILEQHDSEDNFIEAHLKLSSRDFTLDRLHAVSRRRRLALVLDGFDEVAANASESDRMRLFSRVMRIAARGHSVMLTSRPSYFNNVSELMSLIATLVESDFTAAHRFETQILRRDRPVQDRIDRQQDIAIRRLNAGTFPTFGRQSTAMFVVKPLTKEDILRFLTPHAAEIKKAHGKTPEEIYEFLISVYDLTDLMTRPLLLDMFVELLRAKELKLDEPDLEVGPAGLYHLYINYHLQRDWEKRRFLQRDERLAFARAAAVAMLEAGGSLEATYSSVWDIVRKDGSALSLNRRYLLESNPDGVVTDVRVCSFMNVTSAGRIEFSHKSFMEYFVAETIVSRLGKLEPVSLLCKSLNYEILYFLGSYALVRSDTRLEIVQQLQHVAHRQLEIYRVNLLVALLFSERVSADRSFSDVHFSRIRIAKKEFTGCNMENVHLKNAVLLDVTLVNCRLYNLTVEGEVHGLTVRNSTGILLLSAISNKLRLDRCHGLSVGHAGGGTLSLDDAGWEHSEVTSTGSLMLKSSRVRSVVISIASGCVLTLQTTIMDDTILMSPTAAPGSDRLPRLVLLKSRLRNVGLFFVVITRDQFVRAEQMFTSCRGILVIDDPDRQMISFRHKDKNGVTRYSGWAHVTTLLLISADVYNNLSLSTIRSLMRGTPKWNNMRDWSPERAASILSAALATGSTGNLI